jgi:hypothetical protein
VPSATDNSKPALRVVADEPTKYVLFTIFITKYTNHRPGVHTWELDIFARLCYIRIFGGSRRRILHLKESLQYRQWRSRVIGYFTVENAKFITPLCAELETYSLVVYVQKMPAFQGVVRDMDDRSWLVVILPSLAT